MDLSLGRRIEYDRFVDLFNELKRHEDNRIDILSPLFLWICDS